MIKDVKEILEMFSNTKKLKEALLTATKEECGILLEKKKDGECNISTHGNKLAILIALAALEESLLDQLEVPKPVWEMIKDVTGMEVIK